LNEPRTRSFEEFVRTLVEHFNKNKIVYGITGAVAASYYGVPRTTIDADFVIRISPRERDRLFKSLAEVDVEADVQRIRRQLKSGYNVVRVSDRLSPHQADLILSKDPLERRRGSIMGVKAYFQSPESLILAKLRMIKATVPKERSFKDREDIRHVLANTRVSKRKLLRLAEEQGTRPILDELLKP
jgi:hypothetical protein